MKTTVIYIVALLFMLGCEKDNSGRDESSQDPDQLINTNE